MKNLKRSLLVSAATAALLTGSLPAATIDWNGVAGTPWDTTGDAWSAGSGTTPWDAANGPANIANFAATSSSPSLTGNVFANGVLLQSGVSVALGGTGTLNFVGTSPTLTLGNSLNTNLWFTSSNLLAGSPVVTVAGTPSGTFARFMLEGTTQAVGGLSDASGTLVVQNSEPGVAGPNNTGTGTLILNGAGTYSTNGIVRDQTGKLAIVKDGTGTQTFVGGNITYTGATTINSGTLVLENATGFNSAVTVNAGGVLTTTGAGTAATGAASSLTLNGGTYNQNATNWRVWGTGPLSVTGAGGTINASNALLFDGGLTGSGNLVINNTGAGSVGFRGTNFSGYSGDLTVNGGQIGASVNGLFANSNVTLNTGATFNTNAVPFTGASNQSFKSLNGNGTLTGGGQTVTLGTNNGSGSFGGAITGSVAIIKTGIGTQTFSGTNTTTGATTVNGGVLNLDYTTNNTSKLANGASLTLGGGTVQLTGGSHTEIVASTILNAGFSQIVRTSGTGVLQMGTITRNTGATIDFSADNIATTTTGLDASGILGTWATVGGTRYATKSGSNIVGFTGTAAASVNNFVSATVNYEYALSGGTDTMTASRIANTVRYSGSGETIDLGAAGANTLTFGSIMNAGTGTLVIQRTGGAGSVILAAGGDNIITRAGGDITITAPISSGSLSKTGAGTLTLSGNNTYAGTTTINGGTLRTGSATALGAATNALTVSQGATLDLNGNTVAVGSIADNTSGLFGGTVTNSNAAASVLTVGSANTSTTFGGVFQNGVGTLGLTKTGTGTLTLSGNNAVTGMTGALTTTGGILLVTGTSTYTGVATVNGGTLQIGTGGTTGALGGGNNLLGTGGAVLTSGTLAINRSDATVMSGSISGAGSVTYAGGGTTTYSGTASNAGHTGTTTVTQANVVLSKTSGVAIGGDLILNSSAANSANVWATQSNQTSGTGILNFASATNQARFMLEGTTQSFAGITNAAAGIGVIQNAEAGFDGGLANTGTGTLNLTGSGSYTYSGLLRDGVSGKLALTVNLGAGGSQTLSGANISYTGGTTLNSGTLTFVGANNGIGGGMTLAGGILQQTGTGFLTVGGPLNVTTNSVVNVTNNGASNQLFFDGGITGSGNLTLNNTGTATTGVTFRNASTGAYTGAVTVVGGAVNIGTNANLALANSNVTLTGATLNLAGAFGTGASNASVGTLTGNAASSVTLGAQTLTVGGNNGSATFAGVISGAGGGITKTGTGTQTLSGNNTYSGATTVNAGSLLLTGANTLAGGLTVNNGGTLSVSGGSTLNGLTTVNRGGVLNLSGAIGGTGATTVSGGTLNLDYSTQNNSKLANGAALTLGGATVNLTGGTHIEAVGSTIFAAGDTQINRTSGTAQLNLGAITVQTGATADFSTAGFAITSTSNDVSGILGANITVNNGQDYAVNNGDVGGGVGHIVAAAAVSVGRLGPGNVILSNSTANYKIIEAGTTGNITLGGVGVTQANTINNASTGGMAVIDTNGNSLVLGVAGGILGGTSSAGLTIGTAPNAGSLSAGGTTANAAGSITVTNNSAVGMVINSTVINHGTGAVSLTKTGAGSLTLNGTNTYTGATGINAGTVIAGSSSALGVNSNVSVASGAILDINGQALATGSLNNVNNQGGTVTNNGAAATLSVGGVNSSGTFSGVIQNGSGALALTKTGTGTQVLLGTNTYGGLTTISAGTLQIGNGGNAGTLGGGNVVNNASLVFNRNDAYTVANAISGTGAITVNSGGTITLTGAVANTQTLTALATSSVPGATIILNRVGGNTVGNVTVGTQSGTGNYAQGAILQLGASEQIADTSTVDLRSQANNNRAGQFQLLGFNETIGGLNSSGNGSGIRVQNGAATDSTLTFTGSGTFGGGGGVMTDGGTGKLNVVKTGAGTQAFQGGGYNYTGTTTVAGGTLSIRSAGFNTSAITVAGGTLDFQAASVNTTIAGTTGLVTITGGTTNFGGGTGTKTYSTLTQISGGATLSQSDANSFSTLSRHDVAVGSTLTTNGDNGAIGSLTGAGQVALTGSAAVLSIGGDNTTDAIFSGQIGGATAADQAGGIRKYGTGTQTLTGNLNNYVGTTTVADGILRIGNGGTTGVIGTGAVSLLSPGTLEFKRSDTPTIANQISGDGNLAQTGTGTLTLTGANTYSGTTTVASGTLKAGVATLGGTAPSSGAFGVNSAMTVASGATLDLNGFDESLGSLSGAGSVTSSNATARTLTVGTGGLSGNFSGVIANGVGGTTGLFKTGAGTQTLSGSNTYTGTTTVGGGTLALDFSAVGAPANNIIQASSPLVMSGGTLVITGKSGATLTQGFSGTTVTGGSTLQLAQNGATSLDVSLGALNFSGGGLTFMGGTGTAVGARFITTSSAGANDSNTRLGGGSLWSNGNFASIQTILGVNYVVEWAGVITDIFTGPGGTGLNTVIPNSGGASVSIVTGGGAGTNTLQVSTTTVDSLSMKATDAPSLINMAANSANDTLVVGSGVNATGDILISNGVGVLGMTVGQSANQGFLTSGSSGASNLNLSNNSATELLTVNSAVVNNAGGGAVAVNVSGGGSNGKVVFAGANTYTGNTSIGGGTLQITGTGALGANTGNSYAGDIAITGGTLQYSSGVNQTLTGVISGNGDLIKDTDTVSTLTLTNNNTYGGATLISAGHLQVGNGGATGTLGSGNVTNNADLIFNRDNSSVYTVANLITGTGTVVKKGTGTVVYTADNSYAGVTTIENGTLQLGNGGTTGSFGAGNVALTASTSILAINHSNNVTLTNVINGLGGVTQMGTGTTTLTASNTYTGVTTISGGVLQASTLAGGGSASSIGAAGVAASNLVLGGGGTLAYVGTGTGNTNRGFTLAGNATVTNLTTAEFLSMSGGGVHNVATNDTLTLNNVSVALSTLSGALTQNAGILNVNKTGTGTWALTSGASNYTGTTTVTTGILQVQVLANGGANSSIGASTNAAGNLVLNAGTTLSYTGGNTTTDHNFTLNGSATLAQDGAANSTLTWTGAPVVTSAGTTVLTLGGGADVNTRTGIMAGVLSNGAGTLELTKSGTSTWALTNANTYSGVTRVNSGILQIGNGGNTGTLGTNTSVVLGGGNLAFNRNDAISIAKVISGNGTVSQIGTGTTTLTGNGTGNTYTGATIVSNGVLKAGIATNAFGNNTAVTVGTGGTTATLDLAGFSENIGSLSGNANGVITSSVAGAVTLTTTGGSGANVASYTYGGVIQDGSGTVALTKTTANTEILTGTNTYSGLTTISGGSLWVGNGGITGTLGSGNVVNNGTLAFNRSNNLTVANTISGTGVVQQIGSGTTVLSPTNTYTGKTQILNGAFSVATINSVTTNATLGTVHLANSDLGSPTTVANGTIDLGSGGTTGALIYTGAGEITDRVINLNGTTGGGTLDQSGTGLLRFTSNFTATGSGAKTLTLQGSTAGVGEIDGTIVDSAGGATSLVKAGTGTWVLLNNNTFTGSTTINAGTLQLGNGGTQGSIGSINIVNNGTLAINRSDAVTYSGSVSGTGSLVQRGTGTTTLTGISTYTGKTIIENGVLAVDTIQNMGALTGSSLGRPNVGDVANSYIDLGTSSTTGTLKYTGAGNSTDRGFNLVGNGTLDQSGTGTLTIAPNGIQPAIASTTAGAHTLTLTGSSVGDGLISGIIADGVGTVGLTKSGTGTWTLSGANTYTGDTNVTAGVLNIQNSTALGTTAGDTTVASGAALQLQNNIAVGAGEALTLNGTGVSNDGALRNISDNNSWAGPITLGSASRINSDAGLLTLSGGIGGAAQNLTLGGAGDTTVSGAIATTTGTLTKDGAGTVTLSGTNTYTGATTVSAGTLAITGSTASTAVDIATGAILSVANGAAILDTAAVTSAGTGSFVLNGSETIGSLAGTGTVSLGANTLTTGGNNTSTAYAGVIDGTGGLTKSGTGTFTLTGTNTYTGATGITDGTLAIGGGGSLGGGNYGGNINLGATGTLQYNSTVAQTLSGAISGTGALTQSGPGTLTLSGTSTGFSGATTVNAGILAVTGSIANSATTVNTGGTLTGTGTVGATTVNTGGTLFNNVGSTLNLGATTVAAGATTKVGLGATTNPALFAVTGNLSLAGSLDVDDLGGFSTGTAPIIHHLYTYTGALSGAGLTIDTGALPAGANASELFVQTSINGQVNLIDTNGAVLNYWDGDNTALYNNNAANGGNGVWVGGTTKDNWTDLNGAVNAPMNPTAFAFFAGAAGTVTVDDSTTQPTAAGLYFMTTGYTLTGGSIVLANGGNGSPLHAESSVSATIGSVLKGTENITKTGDGTITLGGVNTYTGSTAVNAGTLAVTGSIASSAVSIATGATLSVSNGAAISDTAAITSAGTGAFVLNGSETIGSLAGTGTVSLGANTLTTGGTNASTTYDGVIGGTGGLTKAGTGNFTLTGTNTYTGDTSIAGTLTIDGGGVLGGGNYAGAVTNNGSLVYSSTADQTLGGLISGTGSLTKDEASTLTLTGANSYAGTTGVNAGVLNIQNSTALGTAAGGTSVASGAALQLQNDITVTGEALTLNGTGVSTDGALRNISGNNTWTGAVTLGSASRINSDAGLLTLSGGIGGAAQNLTVGGAGDTTVSGVIATTTGTLTKDGAGTLTLSNTNTFTGATAVNAGTLAVTGSIASSVVDIATGATLAVSNGAAISDTAAVTSAGTGAFVLNNSETIGSLAGTGTVSLGANTLTTGGNNTSTAYAGVIGGTGGLTKSGTGNFTLTGVNTYTGDTAITGGTLTVGGAGGLNSGNYAGNIANGGTLVYASSADQTLAGTVSGGGTLTQSGPGTLTLTGTNTYTGATAVTAGTLVVTGSIASSAVTVSGGTLTGTGTVGATTVNSGGRIDAGSVNPSAIGSIGTLTVGGNLTLATGATFVADINGATAYDQVKVTGAGSTVNLGGASLVLNSWGSVSGGNILTLIDNTGNLAVTGTFAGLAAGANVSAGSNTFKIFYDAGDGNDVVLVSTALPRPLYINNEWTVSATVDGDLEEAGNQTAFVGVNAFDSVTTALTNYVTVSGGAAYADDLYVNGGNYTDALLAGGGAVRMLLVSDDLNAQPDVLIQNLTGDADDAIVTQFHGVPGNGDLIVQNGNFAGTISGGGSLTKNGAGTLTLSGTNTYTGTTDVQAGALYINGNQSAATGLTTVAGGATLGGSGTIGGDVTVSGGTLAPGSASAPGTLTLNGKLTLDSASTLSYRLGSSSDLIKTTTSNTNQLTLDGTLNIADSGGFGPGIYRLIDYTGGLTALNNQGLGIGSVPLGTNAADLYVQTSVANQVNLVNTTGVSLQYWDGPVHTAALDGGNGVWQGSNPTANDNWTTDQPPFNFGINSNYKPAAYAIFGGTPGTVTVDSQTQGAINSSGMQFMVDGYTVTPGDPADFITLVPTAPSATMTTINVGDGTTNSSAMTATIDVRLTGTSGLLKGMDGTLVLGGANDYTGDTTVAGGTLAVTGSIASSAVSIATGATLSVSNGAAISDTAAITSAGTGAFVLNNSETIGSLAGTGTVNLNGNTLTTGDATNTTYAGVIGGTTGGLTKAGTGDFTLTGVNTYAGDTAITDGTLTLGGAGSLGGGNYAGNIANAGALVYASSATQTLGGVISGGGTLTQNGPGTLTLSGDSSGYTGATSVTAGTLAVTGSIASSAVTVSGGTLTGTGTVGTTTVSGGTLNAGTVGTTGTLTIDGDLTLTAGGTFGADIASDSAYDKVVVTGALDLGGSTLSLLGSGPVSAGQVLTLIDNQGAGSVTGTFNALAAGASVADGMNNFKIFYNGGDAGDGTGNDVVLVNTKLSSPLFVNDEWTAPTVVDGDLELVGAQTAYVGVNASSSVDTALSGYKADNSNADYAGDIFVNGGTYASVNLAGGGAVTLKLVNDGANSQAVTTIQDLQGDSDDAIVTQHYGVSGNGDLTVEQGAFAGIISGGGGLTKTNPGILTLSGANTYTGLTSVDGGTLAVDGSIAGNTTVNTGGTLTGAGTIGGTVLVNSGATLANTAGVTLTTGALTLDTGSTTKAGLGATENVTELFRVNGDLTLNGVLDLDDAGGFNTGGPGPTLYRLFTYTGGLTNAATVASDFTISAGLLPVGVDPANLIIQTSVDGQVNLINTNGALLRYWDGDDTGLYNNNAVNGGDGVWYGTSGGAGSVNWTDDTGAVTAYKAADSYAVFAGLAGIVTVDDTTAGTPDAQGLYFQTDGYRLVGGSILLANGGSGAILDAAANVTANIGSELKGTENLTKQGDGTIILSGDNSYTGTTTVAAGTLQVGDGGTTGTLGLGDVINNAALVFDRSDVYAVSNAISGTGTVTNIGDGELTLAGVISGSNALHQNGAGTTVLTAANTYSGTTTITAGTLQVGNGGTSGTLGSGAVVNDASLVFNRTDVYGVANDISGTGTVTNSGSGTLTLSGVISGSNSLVQSAGTLVLTGTNTYSGTTTINTASTLQVGDGGTSGTLGSGLVNVGSGATLVFNRSDMLTVDGQVTAADITSTLVQRGAGTTVLAANSTYAGRIIIEDGVLQVGAGAASGTTLTGYITVMTGANLTFDRSDTTTVSAMIDGAGEFIQEGTGKTVITGDTSGFTGQTTINHGILELNTEASPTTASLGPVTINADGTLMGTGTIRGPLHNFGTLSIGHSPGALNVIDAGAFTGDFINHVGSFYNEEIGGTPGSGLFDVLNVSGTATIDGGALRVLSYNNYPPVADPSSRYRIINAAGGVILSDGNGNGISGFDNVVGGVLQNDDFAALRVMVDYGANYVDLYFLFDGLKPTAIRLGLTPNRISTAGGLDDAATANPAFGALTTKIGALNDAAFARSLASLSPQGFERLWDDCRYNAVLLNNAVESRLQSTAWVEPDENIWVQAIRRVSQMDGDKDLEAGSAQSTGVIIGADTAFGSNFTSGDKFTVGAMFEYSNDDVNFGLGGGSRVNRYLPGLYARYRAGDAFVDAVGSYGYADYTSTRRIEIGSEKLTAKSRTESVESTVNVRAGYEFHVLKDELGLASLTFAPYAGFAHTRWETDGFTETGAGLANLSVHEMKAESTVSRLGFLANAPMHLGDLTIIPRVDVAWRHEFQQSRRDITANFGPAPFTVRTMRPADDAVEARAGLDVKISPRTTIYADFGCFWDGAHGHSEEYRFGVNVKF